MNEYWELIENRDDIERGMFVILPLTCKEKIELEEKPTMCQRISFESSDFIDILTDKCSKERDFVQRYKLNVNLDPIQLDTEISITDLQLFVFDSTFPA